MAWLLAEWAALQPDPAVVVVLLLPPPRAADATPVAVDVPLLPHLPVADVVPAAERPCGESFFGEMKVDHAH